MNEITKEEEKMKFAKMQGCGNDYVYINGFEEKIEKDKKPDLVLLDIMLPDEDGLEILSKLQKNPETKRLPVIMVTAKTTELDRVKGLDLGADDYISKPFNFRELAARVDARISRFKTLRSLKNESSLS